MADVKYEARVQTDFLFLKSGGCLYTLLENCLVTESCCYASGGNQTTDSEDHFLIVCTHRQARELEIHVVVT